MAGVGGCANVIIGVLVMEAEEDLTTELGNVMMEPKACSD